MVGVAACVFVIVPWLTLRPVKRRAKLRRLFSRQHLMYAAAITAIGSWVFAMRAAYSGKDPESGFALVFWSITILALAFCGLLQCWKRVGEIRALGRQTTQRYRRIIAAFGLFACAL